MKKVFMFGLAAAMAIAASIFVVNNNKEQTSNSQDEICMNVSTQGRGPCTMPNCKCPKFNQRPGYNQCWCGHQSFVHK